ncbi:MAG: hypothetical protein KatS3mg059_0693 [Thermomicrobiales bacterium]|nr:MAG: hypothetical protein KatS3mg059_0693 [Thermomicrobiales bacterium]
MRHYLTVIALACAWVALVAPMGAAQAAPPGVPEGVEEGRVWGYIDGDKFNVRIGDKTEELNLIGADAPEPAKDDDLGECFAQEAAQRVRELLPKQSVVYLEKDKTNRDRKKRLLRYVWVAPDGEEPYLLNERLIREGFASFKSKDKNTHYDERLKKAEEDAKAEQRGLWKACGGPHVELTPPPEIGTADNPAPIGATLTKDDREITLVSARFVESYDLLDPDPGNVFLEIEVIIKNVHDAKERSYNELCFSAVDPDRGYKFDDTLFNFSDQPLGSGDLGPGDIVRGTVVLEVKADSARIRVKYDSGCGFGGKSFYWIVVR